MKVSGLQILCIFKENILYIPLVFLHKKGDFIFVFLHKEFVSYKVKPFILWGKKLHWFQLAHPIASVHTQNALLCDSFLLALDHDSPAYLMSLNYPSDTF